MTYHDPCYLGRHNQIYSPPRELLGALPGVELAEMPRNKEMSFCCGAGGARMWMEESIGTRISTTRAAEAVATGADVIATACPYCTVMLSDGVAAGARPRHPHPSDLARRTRGRRSASPRSPTSPSCSSTASEPPRTEGAHTPAKPTRLGSALLSSMRWIPTQSGPVASRLSRNPLEPAARRGVALCERLLCQAQPLGHLPLLVQEDPQVQARVRLALG